MSKKEDNQFMRMLFPTVLATLIGTIAYIRSGKESNFFILFILVFCVMMCIVGLGYIAKKHKENSDEIED